MPTYVYKFVDTGETIEVQQSFDEPTLTEAPHPADGQPRPVKKVFTPVGITFRGNGFYKTDSRGSKSSASSSGSSSSGSDSGSTSPSTTTTTSTTDSGSSSSSTPSSNGSSSSGESSKSTATPSGSTSGSKKTHSH